MKGIDPALLTQLITAGIALLTALAALIQSVVNGKKVDNNTKITIDSHAKLSELANQEKPNAPTIVISNSNTPPPADSPVQP